ncbi:MAG TPA: SAM-dependent chlorinase/fluorinase [Anaerolineales bacterium]|nr:SAM-dependent chlorinase/fluorinase [Anaerolineales bacterium]
MLSNLAAGGAGREATIVLLTDFHPQDTYIGVMKGVLATLAPRARVIDLAHGLPIGDIHQAAFKLWQATPYFPEGSIYVAVVDPGVGSARRAIAASWPGFSCVGPDNGVFTYLLVTHGEYHTALLQPERLRTGTPSLTFHGRDIFAPAAALLANGLALDQIGPVTGNPQRFALPKLELIEGPRVRGEILHPDRFGNLITSIGVLQPEADELLLEPWLPHCPPARLPRRGLRLRLPNGLLLGLSNTFADVASGEPLMYIGSDGMLEIGINRGSASTSLAIAPGQEVLLTYQG